MHYTFNWHFFLAHTGEIPQK